MPELPEVQTTVDGLQSHAIGHTLTDVWTDLAVKSPINQFKDTLKSESFFKHFKKTVMGHKITHITRRAKNILIHLDNKTIILVHMKMTGHMMMGKYDYDKKKNIWIVSPTEKNEALHDPYNRFVHVVWTLQKGKTEKSSFSATHVNSPRSPSYLLQTTIINTWVISDQNRSTKRFPKKIL